MGVTLLKMNCSTKPSKNESVKVSALYPTKPKPATVDVDTDEEEDTKGYRRFMDEDAFDAESRTLALLFISGKMLQNFFIKSTP